MTRNSNFRQTTVSATARNGAASAGLQPHARSRRVGAPAQHRAAEIQHLLLACAMRSGKSTSSDQNYADLVCNVLQANAVVITFGGRTHARTVHFATSGDAQSVALPARGQSPLKTSLRTSTDFTNVTDKDQSRFKIHAAAISVRGWKSYFSAPLVDGSNRTVGSIVAYFAARTGVVKKRKIFHTTIHAPLSAIASATLAIVPAIEETNNFDSLAATIPGVVYQRVVRPDGDIRYTYLSEGAREIFGVAPEEVLKDPEVLFRTYSEDYKKSFRERLVQASKSLTKWDVEASIDQPDGSKKYTHAIAHPERRADGSVLWTGVILDASRAKKAEESLKSANRLVESANQAKSAFLAKMSHEMRTPLNGVMGMGDLLLKTDLAPRQLRLATTLCDSAKGLLGIINDVLDLSRVESGQFKLDLQQFNLQHCVEDAVELCATAGFRKGLEVILIISPDVPVGVKSDPMRLRQILINLIGNAIKFTEVGHVAIRVSAEPQLNGNVPVTLEVIDTGIGIDQASIGRLFEPFAQADSSISRRFGGTGLGLSITRHLVELLGGEIALTSQPGKGTSVKVTVNFECASAQMPTILNKVALADTRVLVMDDRPLSREMIAANLTVNGLRVEFATSEAEALECLRSASLSEDPIKVAIIDRVKPRTSNLHLCRTIRSCPELASLPLIAMMSTNWNPNAGDRQGLDGVEFLSKPVRRATLLAAIANAQFSESDIEKTAAEISGVTTTATAPSQALNLRVLLVEDNFVNIEVAQEYLAEMNCRVTVAGNGIEALAAYDRGTFDVIMMDSQMPEMDGLTATSKIREKEQQLGSKRTPIISVTANAYDSDRAQAFQAGSDDFLSKPFSETQLRDALLRWVPCDVSAPSIVASG
jgi:signal transduction histidine kinase/CheY-like chemotaxis protein